MDAEGTRIAGLRTRTAVLILLAVVVLAGGVMFASFAATAPTERTAEAPHPDESAGAPARPSPSPSPETHDVAATTPATPDPAEPAPPSPRTSQQAQPAPPPPAKAPPPPPAVDTTPPVISVGTLPRVINGFVTGCVASGFTVTATDASGVASVVVTDDHPLVSVGLYWRDGDRFGFSASGLSGPDQQAWTTAPQPVLATITATDSMGNQSSVSGTFNYYDWVTVSCDVP